MGGASGRLYRRCGCVDVTTGRELGSRCPRLGERGHGSWYVYAELPRRVSGRRERFRRGGYPTKRAAREALERLRTPVDGARAGPAVTVGWWLHHWLANRCSVRPSTLRGYTGHVRLYLVPYLGRVLLAELSAAQVQAMFAAIIRRHDEEGRPVTPSTLSRIRATLRAALNAAVRQGLIAANPASRVELPPARRPHAVVWTSARVTEWEQTGVRPPVAVWTAAQTAQFLHAVRDHRMYPVFHLIALRGLGRGEAAGLRWCDVDLDGGAAMIHQQLQQYDGRVVVGAPKTRRSARIVALDHTTVAALRRHRERQRAERDAGGDQYRDKRLRVHHDARGPDSPRPTVSALP
jgi:integrase